MLKIQHLRTYVAVYQERSFTSAAKQLNATQSGLSMQVKELEESLGVRLLTRNSAGVEPTIVGETFYKRAVIILRELSSAEEEIRSIGSKLSGRVVVGLMPTFSRAVLPSVLKEFTQEHPLVDLQIFEAFSGVLAKAVITGEADFAIVPQGQGEVTDGLKFQHVATDYELFVTRTDTTRKDLDPINLKTAGPLKLILPRAGNSRRARLETYLNEVGARVESILDLDSMMGTLTTISESDWVSILPGTLCITDVGKKVRKLHPITVPRLTVDYFLIQSQVRVLNPAAQIIAEHFIQRIKTVCAEVRTCL